MTGINITVKDKICPFMSGRPVTVAMPQVIEHQSAQGVTTMMVSCAKEKCALWRGDLCALQQESLTTVLGNVAVGLTDVSDGLRPFNAPLTGSPTTRLVDAIDRLIEILSERKVVPK